MVEFSLVLPVLLLVVFGIFTFGIAFSNFLVLEAGTNVGARQLAISRSTSTPVPCAPAASAIITATPTLTGSSLTFYFVLNGTAYSGTTCTSAASNMAQNAVAKVTVTYPCNLTSYKWSYGACTLTASTAEMIQ